MERETSKFSMILFIAFTLCVFGALSAGAAEGTSMEMSASGIFWQAGSEATSHHLTVSGGGLLIERHFKAGEAPTLSIFTEEGQLLPDGSYTWELKTDAVVTDDQRRAMQRARAAEEALSATYMPRAGKSQFGYFTIQGGAFVVSDGEEDTRSSKAQKGPVARDQVINDDLIVTFSACIGNDCVNGESFGFDTLRLKENNLRIKAQDTSNSASFPTRDWQITFNETTNGGANKFSIDDIDGGRTPFTIEAGAPSHSLYVDDGGRVGLGKSTPVVELHIVDGDTPTVRLEQDGSSGFTAQTWDLASNETNFFIRDATNGSRLPFKIIPAAPTNTLVLTADGDVGVNTSSPSGRLHVVGNTTNDPSIYLQATNGTDPRTWRIRSTPNSGNFSINDDGGNVAFKFAPGAQNNLLRLGIEDNGLGVASDQANTVTIGSGTAGDDMAVLDVHGSIKVNGMTVPDYVFQSDYDLLSIEEHAEFMWANSHLPKLPKAPEGFIGKVDLGQQQTGMLEELETAHIYIDQLNNTVKKQNKLLEELQERLEALEGNQN